MWLQAGGMIVRASYAWASPYVNADPRKLVGADYQCIYGEWVRDAEGFREKLKAVPERPEVFLLGNFCHHRAALAAICLEEGINYAHWEDGFFPHYDTQHLDPVGFCWESSLPLMTFRGCSDGQRQRARTAREAWLARPVGALPAEVRRPFVLWPLQLIGDQVNRCDMNVRDWSGLIRDFRRRLPVEFQLVLKEHPLAVAADMEGLAEVVEDFGPNQVLLAPRSANLAALLRECRAVAGVNSSVLYEARLMHRLPVYAYGRSWFTNHPELIQPLTLGGEDKDTLPHLIWLEEPNAMRTQYDDLYADWFLAQLLARQIDRRVTKSVDELREAIWLLSSQAYEQYGEALLD